MSQSCPRCHSSIAAGLCCLILGRRLRILSFSVRMSMHLRHPRGLHRRTSTTQWHGEQCRPWVVPLSINHLADIVCVLFRLFCSRAPHPRPVRHVPVVRDSGRDSPQDYWNTQRKTSIVNIEKRTGRNAISNPSRIHAHEPNSKNISPRVFLLIVLHLKQISTNRKQTKHKEYQCVKAETQLW